MYFIGKLEYSHYIYSLWHESPFPNHFSIFFSRGHKAVRNRQQNFFLGSKASKAHFQWKLNPALCLHPRPTRKSSPFSCIISPTSPPAISFGIKRWTLDILYPARILTHLLDHVYDLCRKVDGKGMFERTSKCIQKELGYGFSANLKIFARKTFCFLNSDI